MKTLFFYSILSILSISSIFSQPNLEWDTRWNGPIYNDEGKLIAVDNDGNVYVTCTSDSTTLKDWLTIKYSPEGEVLWTRRVNGTANGDDEPKDIKIDNNGNVYITGYTYNQRPTYADRDMYTIKYSPNGIIQWTKLEEDVYTGLKIIFDVFGNVYIAGGDINSIDYSYIYKFSPSGVFKWQTYIGLSNYNYPQTIKKMEFNVFGNLNIEPSLKST